MASINNKELEGMIGLSPLKEMIAPVKRKLLLSAGFIFLCLLLGGGFEVSGHERWNPGLFTYIKMVLDFFPFRSDFFATIFALASAVFVIWTVVTLPTLIGLYFAKRKWFSSLGAKLLEGKVTPSYATNFRKFGFPFIYDSEANLAYTAEYPDGIDIEDIHSIKSGYEAAGNHHVGLIQFQYRKGNAPLSTWRVISKDFAEEEVVRIKNAFDQR